MRTLSPCLDEQWFVEDGLALLAGLCPMCRRALAQELRLFGSDNASALHQIYVQSRAIRVQAIFRNNFAAAHGIGDWEALLVLRTVLEMILLATGVLFEQQPKLFLVAKSGEAK